MLGEEAGTCRRPVVPELVRLLPLVRDHLVDLAALAPPRAALVHVEV